MYKHIRTLMAAPMTTPQIDQLLLQPEVEESPRNILNALNDHCLCKILVRLSLFDLCSIAKTCKRLNQIAKTVFESKYKNKSIRLHDVTAIGGETMANIAYFLSNFGSSITSIHLDDGLGEGDVIVGLVDQHCKTIRSLRVDGELMGNVTENNYHTELFGRLETVNIVGGFLGVNQFLNACPQLKVLQAMMIDCLDFRRVSLPYLIELNLAFFKCAGMADFLIRHPHIEVLSMTWPDPMVTYSLSDDTNQFIFDHLPNIRKMEMFEISTEKVTRLSEMGNLRSVYLDFDKKSFSRVMKEFAAKKTPIETLELASGVIGDNAIGYICELKTVTKINFFQCTGLDVNKLMRLVQNLPKIQSILDCSDELLNLDDILPTFKRRRIEWLNEISCNDDDTFVFYVSRMSLFFVFSTG